MNPVVESNPFLRKSFLLLTNFALSKNYIKMKLAVAALFVASASAFAPSPKFGTRKLSAATEVAPVSFGVAPRFTS